MHAVEVERNRLAISISFTDGSGQKVVAPVDQHPAIAKVFIADVVGSEGFRFPPSCQEKVVSCSLSHGVEDLTGSLSTTIGCVVIIQ